MYYLSHILGQIGYANAEQQKDFIKLLDLMGCFTFETFKKDLRRAGFTAKEISTFSAMIIDMDTLFKAQANLAPDQDDNINKKNAFKTLTWLQNVTKREFTVTEANKKKSLAEPIIIPAQLAARIESIEYSHLADKFLPPNNKPLCAVIIPCDTNIKLLSRQKFINHLLNFSYSTSTAATYLLPINRKIIDQDEINSLIMVRSHNNTSLETEAELAQFYNTRLQINAASAYPDRQPIFHIQPIVSDALPTSRFDALNNFAQTHRYASQSKILLVCNQDDLAMYTQFVEKVYGTPTWVQAMAVPLNIAEILANVQQRIEIIYTTAKKEIGAQHSALTSIGFFGAAAVTIAVGGYAAYKNGEKVMECIAGMFNPFTPSS